MNILFLLLFWRPLVPQFFHANGPLASAPDFEKELADQPRPGRQHLSFHGGGLYQLPCCLELDALPHRLQESIAVGFVVLIGGPYLPGVHEDLLGSGGCRLCSWVRGGLYLPCALPCSLQRFTLTSGGRLLAFHETAATFSILVIPLLAAAALRFLDWTALVMALSGFAWL